MTGGRSFPFRAIGLLTVVTLLAVNGWLVALNLAKHGRLPAALSSVPGLEVAVAKEAAPVTRPIDGNVGGLSGDPSLLVADDPVPDGSAAAPDDWPGGVGAPPDGQPAARRLLLGADGALRLVGSAPTWAVVTEVSDLIARRLDRDPSAIDLSVEWHPDASDRIRELEVELAEPIRFDGGVVELPDDGPATLVPVVGLLSSRQQASAVVIGRASTVDGTDADSAVALARVTAVADALVAAGVPRERVLTVVGPAPVGDDGGSGSVGPTAPDGTVVIRVQNLLTPSAG